MTGLLLILCTFLIVSLSSFSNNIVESNEFIFERAPFLECHSSSIESTNNGMIATWFAGTKEGNEDVEIWIAHYRNGRWSAPMSVANGMQDNGKRYPCWNPVLYQVPNGPLLLFYKVGPTPSQWWGELKKSFDEGKSWTEAVRLPNGILGPIKNKPFRASDGRLVCPSSTEMSPDTGWKMHFEITSDNGATWAVTPDLEDPSELNAIQPSILNQGDGVLQAVARSKDGGIVQSWSYDNGRTWDSITPLGLPNPNSGIDAVTLREGFHILVYNHSDKPKNKWSGFRSPLNVAISVDGKHWQNILELERLENNKGELSYPAVVQGKDNLIHITYTWKRRRIKHVVLDPIEILKKYPDLNNQIINKKKIRTKSVIFDTDTGNDIDDVLALSMLYNYQKSKKVDILGITINKANDITIPFIDIMNCWYGYNNIPIGYIGKNGATPDEGRYLKSVVNAKKKNGKPLFERKLDNNFMIPEAWKLQRKLLAKQPDHSVVIISVGFLSNLAKLLNSKPDEISGLSGYELVRKKVKVLSVMAGNFKNSQKAEYNIVKDINSASYVFENWPGKIIINGWEVGEFVRYPSINIEKKFCKNHPLRIAYTNFDAMPYDRQCWDLISVLVAIEENSPGLSLSKLGRVIVNPKGGTTFIDDINGQHQYLLLDRTQIDKLVQILVSKVTAK